MEGIITEFLASPWVSLVLAFGIPAVIVRRFEMRLDKREKKAEEREKYKEELEKTLIRSTTASIALGEATARAVQRLPDAHCNGDMTAALSYVKTVKDAQKDFLAGLGVHYLHED